MRVLLLAAFVAVSLPSAAADYFPPKGDGWATHTPAQERLDAARLKAAIDFAISAEPKYPPELARNADIRDLRISVPLKYAKEPFNSPIGPLKPHAPANGIIIRHGYIVAEWGATRDVDMTFSVTKTFVSSVAGVAFDKGMIRNINDRVIDYVQPTPDFALPHNQPITWNDMLRQQSGWIGTLWGKPWWADRPTGEAWSELAKGPPPVGKEWKYNDVRVNALALALTHLWRRELPDVMKQYIGDPIGLSDSWHWEGYDNSFTEIDGKRLKVGTGGGHWGGGMFLTAYDQGRLGLLMDAPRSGCWLAEPSVGKAARIRAWSAMRAQRAVDIRALCSPNCIWYHARTCEWKAGSGPVPPEAFHCKRHRLVGVGERRLLFVVFSWADPDDPEVRFVARCLSLPVASTAVDVPGAIAGLKYAVKRYGTQRQQAY